MESKKPRHPKVPHRQCAKCPWKKSTNPHDIPNGYSVQKHRNLKRTIAEPGLAGFRRGGERRAMACHETHNKYCVGWLFHQLGPGNNIGLRMEMMSYDLSEEAVYFDPNDQHDTFEDTLPEEDDY